MAKVVAERDVALVTQISDSASELSDVQMLGCGQVFITARAIHRRTELPVLLTIARPADSDAVKQLSAVRKMLMEVNDERLGIVIDRIWQRPAQSGWACLVSSLHEDLVQLESVFTQDNVRRDVNILNILRGMCRQLALVHRAGYAHGDLSTANIGVDRTGKVHLIDFEHVVSNANLSRPRIGLTPAYAHPDKMTALSDQLIAVSKHQSWDRYSAGMVILDVLNCAAPFRFPELTHRNQRAIRLIGCLLLDGKNTDGQIALGLPARFFSEEAFNDMTQAVEAFDKLLGRSRIEDLVPELDPSVLNVVELGGRRPIPFTGRVRALLEQAPLRQLNEFRQLGLISFIWPTASHTRFEHALGTFGVSCAVIRSLLADPENPLFSVVMTPKRVEAVLLAALLHDVGHYPLAHDLEEAHFVAFDHEARSISLLLNHVGLRKALTASAEHGWDSRSEDVASVIAGEPVSGAAIAPLVCGLLHSIISGPIDADKLDYLTRDSARLNVAAGQGIDIDRVVSSLTTAVVVDGTGSRVVRMAVRAKGRRPTELVGRIRSHMFGVAYWHHSYRSIKAMIHWITWAAIECNAKPGGKRNTAARNLASVFFERLDMAVAESAAQPELSGMKVVIQNTGVLPRAEADVLGWLAERGGAEAAGMLSLLNAHRWFRSILTIEHPRQEEIKGDTAAASGADAVWSAMEEIYRISEDHRWRVRLAIAREVQVAILKWIAPQTEGLSGTIVVDFEAMRDRLLAAGRTTRLFLIDGPDPSRAFQKPLYYTRLHLRPSTSVDAAEAIPAVRSYDDKELGEEFVVTNGAIRLLCHPDFDSFVTQSMPDDVLRDLLTAVLGPHARGSTKR